MIERTQDYRILNRLLDWRPLITDEIFYLLEVQGGKPLGVWSCNKVKGGIMIHADMGPKCRGEKAINSAKEAFKWLFKNVPTKTIYANIESSRKGACQIAARAGMELVRMGETKLYKVVNNG